MASQPPLVSAQSLLLSNDLSRNLSGSLRSQQQLATQSHQQCLLVLARCLNLLFTDRELLSTTGADISHGDSQSTRKSNFLATWTSQWASCQDWYSNRSSLLQPVVEIKHSESSQTNPPFSATFPILVYTTSLALLSNVVYHISSLLLLASRPWHVKVLAGERHCASRLWHAQSIAGMVACSESLDQMDPILIAALLFVAEEMTHESQQQILVENLTKITTVTGIKLHTEIAMLKTSWSISRCDESSYHD